MSFLASLLGSYEGLIVGKIGNPNMTKEDYDQVDPEEMELIDIRWCMASVIRRAQRFMEITGRKYLEGPGMKLGFDKAKVTYFKCKQKGYFKRECTNGQTDDSVNPFHDDYYKKAIYHHNNEQPSRTNQKQIEEGPSKEIKHAAHVVINDDEGFNWNDYTKDERKEQKWVLVAEIKQIREERHPRMRLDEVYDAYKEATRANKWSQEKECYVDPQGSPMVDPDEVDFEALVAAIPTVGVWCKGLEEIPRYREKVEEIVDKSQKLVDEMKKADEKDEETVAKKQQKSEED
ncbi:putative transcription factor interactor and regulator CCHC(Zn) family [Helianthus annuus]|uniref:Transcription factor interactor and regulator CCHC(Zn) family n=1 Tax=Helianthus annuus TaxID=4232 RepID=A0A9K3DIE1_HELAN|nr:putative transcription factor interactor and regulator CCHC(Zn) family [Helianthus annuus]KAJ0429591.1 putative transcription factor interactor and regulator CCHC(Zn) family [Helianthus annuus]